jgi:uncharacterized OB-fold protein
MSTTLVAEPEVELLDPVAEGGTVYTETIVWSPPKQFVADVPYQLAIVTLDTGDRLTGRIEGEKVRIGDRVILADSRNGIPYFRRAA